MQFISADGATSLSGCTYSGDSDDEFAAQLAEEGLAPDSEAQLTAALLGALFHPDMTIGTELSHSTMLMPTMILGRRDFYRFATSFPGAHCKLS